MVGKINVLIQTNLESHLKRYKSALIYSFIIGLVMGSLPFIYKYKESMRVQTILKKYET